MDDIIGDMNWQACEDCTYNDFEKGCTLEDQEVCDNITLDTIAEAVRCGCYTKI